MQDSHGYGWRSDLGGMGVKIWSGCRPDFRLVSGAKAPGQGDAVTIYPPIPKLSEEEFAVFLAVVTEPWQWTCPDLSEDLDFCVLASVDKLRSMKLIAKPEPMQPTHDGIVVAGELGIELHSMRHDPELREKIRLAYNSGCMRIADLAAWFKVSKQCVYNNLRELRRRGLL